MELIITHFDKLKRFYMYRRGWRNTWSRHTKSPVQADIHTVEKAPLGRSAASTVLNIRIIEHYTSSEERKPLMSGSYDNDYTISEI